jgi:hypothetical protein
MLGAAFSAAACSAPVAGASPQESNASLADAETLRAESPLWSKAAQLGVQCVVSSSVVDHVAFGRVLCERVRALAAQGSALPVSVIAPGDPALLQPGTVTLLVHGAVHEASQVASGAQGRFLVFSVRPFGAGADAILFGTAPRAVPLTSDRAEDPALDAALNGALSDILPWRRPQGSGPQRLY